MTGPQEDLSERTAPAAPRSVDRARWLWIIAAVIGFLRSLYQLSDRGRLVSDLHRLSPQLTQEQLDSATNSGILFTIVVSLAVLAVFVVIMNQAVRGRNWARLLVAVLAVIRAIGTVMVLVLLAAGGPEEVTRVSGVAVSITTVDIVANVVVVGLGIVTLVLLFLPESNRFFRDAARDRALRGNGLGGDGLGGNGNSGNGLERKGLEGNGDG